MSLLLAALVVGSPRPAAAVERRMAGGVPAERAFRLPVHAAAEAPFEYRVLVLLVEFGDVRGASGPDRVTPAAVYERLFGEGPGTLASYWREASDGRLILRGTVTPWVRVDSTYAYYASEGAGNLGSGVDPNAYPHNAPRLVEEAVARLGGATRWDLYDNNRDGLVDGLLVVHAGPGIGESSASVPDDPRRVFLAHQFHTRSEIRAGATRIFDYAFLGVAAGYGVAAHEFGHLLGLADLYDTGFFAGASGPFGAGDWSLMATGALVGNGITPTGLDADSRIRLGFAAPIVVPVGAEPLEIAWTGVDRRIVRLPAGPDPREYFLLESRRRVGIDAALPAEGLLIWHVDERRAANLGPDPYRVALVQPDGRNDLGRTNGNRGDAGDVWPAVSGTVHTRFDDTTTPSAETNAGQPTGVIVSAIMRTSGGVSARLDVAREVELRLTDVRVRETAGDGDGLIEPNETAAIDIDLCNDGDETAGPLGFALVIDPASAGQVLAGTPVIHPTLAAGACVTGDEPLRVTVAPGAGNLAAVAARLDVTDPAHDVVASFDLLLPFRADAPVVLTAGPDEPAWRAVSLNPDRSAPWSVVSDRVRTAPGAWRLGPTAGSRYDTELDAVWLSPVVVVPASHPRLTLWSAIDAETLATGRAWDGGRVEMLAAAGGWLPLAPAGGWPVELESGSGNALAGEEAVSGHDTTFRRFVFDLAAAAGRATRFRFRFASDAVTTTDQGQAGWWLDDFRVAAGPAPPDLVVTAGTDTARIAWVGSAPAAWRVYRRADVARAARVIVGEALTTPNNPAAVVVDRPPAGRWIYSIRPQEDGEPGLEYEAPAVTTRLTATRPLFEVGPNPYRLDGAPLSIEYVVPGQGDGPVPVRIRLYDVAGRLIETIAEGMARPGSNRVRWPEAVTGTRPAPGVYWLRLDLHGQSPVSRRLVITR